MVRLHERKRRRGRPRAEILRAALAIVHIVSSVPPASDQVDDHNLILPSPHSTHSRHGSGHLSRRAMLLLSQHVYLAVYSWDCIRDTCAPNPCSVVMLTPSVVFASNTLSRRPSGQSLDLSPVLSVSPAPRYCASMVSQKWSRFGSAGESWPVRTPRQSSSVTGGRGSSCYQKTKSSIWNTGQGLANNSGAGDVTRQLCMDQLCVDQLMEYQHVWSGRSLHRKRHATTFLFLISKILMFRSSPQIGFVST
jgi:hypothetical protein